MKRICQFFLVMVALSFFSTNLLAQSGIYCDSCSVEEIESRVRSLPTGTYNVLDTQRGSLTRYYVVSDYIGSVPFSYVEEKQPSEETLRIFNEGMLAKAEFETSLRNFNASAHDDFTSPWELAGSSRNQNLLIDYARQNMSFFTLFASYVSNLAKLSGVIPPSSYVLTYNFATGGYVKLEVTGYVNGEAQLRIIKIVDANLNDVPLVKSQFNGNFVVKMSDLTGVMSATRNFGGSFMLNGAMTFQGSGEITTVCVETDPRTVSCTGVVE